MEEFDPRELNCLSTGSGSRKGPNCPDVQVLTAALDGEYRVISQSRFEQHVADCDFCLERLGQIARLKRMRGSNEISDLTMARAQKLAHRQPAFSNAARWVAAAAVVLTVLMTAYQLRNPAPPQASPAPEFRNLDHDAYQLDVRLPHDALRVDQPGAVFQWSAVPNSLHYAVRVVSADGAMLWQERVETTEWRLPAELELGPGEEYYFRVDAYLNQAKTVRSRHVMFKVEEGD